MDPFYLLIVGGLGTAIGMFLRPFSERVVDHFFARRPIFASRPLILRGSLVLTVEPLNSMAAKRRPLSVCFEGSFLREVGQLQSGKSIQWKIDLSEIEGLPEYLKANSHAELQFFFDPNRMSDKIKVTVDPAHDLVQQAGAGLPSVFIQTASDLIENIESARRIVIRRGQITISRGFPKETGSVQWNSVFDGKELCISDVTDFEFVGIDAALLAEPKYAWVFNFQNCRNISLRGLTIGHASPGYCMGGVLRFESCSGISIENCDLFGSGTYGLELSDCSEFDITSTTIRDCTYGILRIGNSKNVVFSGCTFTENQQFELCEFSGKVDSVMFRGCTFEKNKSDHTIFSLKAVTGMGLGVFVWDSAFKNNMCPRLVDNERYFSENDNRHTENSWQTSKAQ